MSRPISAKELLALLFQSYNVADLKQICKENKLKGYSKLSKTDLIDFILDSSAEEELNEYLEEKELQIISPSFPAIFFILGVFISISKGFIE